VSLVTLKAAATLLNVSPATLREWTAQYGQPQPVGEPDSEQFYDREFLLALRTALETAPSISAAIRQATETGKLPAPERADDVNRPRGRFD
jgi:transposase-like protein